MRSFKFITFIFVLLLILVVLSGCSGAQAKETPKAVKGVLDLSDWDFNKDGSLALSGEWEFYWEKLLTFGDFTKGAGTTQTDFINLPGKWSGHKVNDHKLGGTGFATYRLKIKVNHMYRMLGIKIMDMGSSYTLYADNKKLNSTGVVGTTKELSKPEYVPAITQFIVDGDEVQLILQVSNFYHRSGGAWGDIILGTPQQVSGLRERNLALELFLFGTIFIMGWYNLAYYMFRRSDPSPFYFSMFCFFISLRTILTGERFLNQLMPWINWEFRYKLEYYSFYLSVIVFSMFLYSLFSKVFHRQAIMILKAVGVAAFILITFTPARIYSQTLFIYHGFTVICAFYALYILIKAVRSKLEGAIISFSGFSALFVTTLNDIFFTSEILRTRYLVPVGLLIFIFCQSIVMSKRFSKAVIRAEMYAAQNEEINKKLKQLNENLEEKIEERTKELQQKNELLNTLANIDSLTGLYNRRYIYTMLEEVIKEARAEGKSFCILMLDIDHFKLINDTYGHQTGDTVLRNIAHVIKDTLREEDFAGRYGGEEFLVILCDTQLNQANMVSERIRENVSKIRFKEKNLHVTISGGLVEYNCENALKLVDHADKLLYVAKNNGRNQIQSISRVLV